MQRLVGRGRLHLPGGLGSGRLHQHDDVEAGRSHLVLVLSDVTAGRSHDGGLIQRDLLDCGELFELPGEYLQPADELGLLAWGADDWPRTWRGAHFGGEVHIAQGGGRDEGDRGVLGIRIDDPQVHAGLQGQRSSARSLGHYSRLLRGRGCVKCNRANVAGRGANAFQLVARTLLQCAVRRGTDGGPRRSQRGALELARFTIPATARRRTTLAAVPRPAAEVAGLLLVEVLRSPRARAAALGLARSLTHWLAGRHPPASAGVEVTTRRVTVVKHANTSVLVYRIETALVV